jgi:translocator assembly and maintenance protein 41
MPLLSKLFLSHAVEELFSKKAMPLITDAFAYGSAVMPQGLGKAGSMIDLLVVVSDTHLFHSFQLESMQRGQYAPWIINAKVADRLNECSAKVYFNPGISVDGRLFKYGIISAANFVDDLYNWTHLFAAGRMHKPVIALESRSDDAIKANRQMALKVSKIITGSNKLDDLLVTITSLSYAGDMRMAFGEDPHKVINILRNQREQLLQIYEPIFHEIDNIQIPNSLIGYNDLAQRCRQIVRRSSWGQAMKGLLTAKPEESLRYVLKKMRKRLCP